MKKPKIYFDFLKENWLFGVFLSLLLLLWAYVYFTTQEALTHVTDMDLLMRYSFQINSTVFQANAAFLGFILLIFSLFFTRKDFEMDKFDYRILLITSYLLVIGLILSLFGLNPTLNPDIMGNQIALIFSVELIIIMFNSYSII